MYKRLFLAATLAIGVIGSAGAECVSHAAYDKILRSNVDRDGYVDYDGIRARYGGSIGRYLKSIETADLAGCTEPERLAFWLNAYNAHAIEKIARRTGLKKVTDDLGLFDEKMMIAKQSLSLNDIENRVLRSDPAKGGPIAGVSLPSLDPRIHFSLVCGAVGCPRLLNRAYGVSDINADLQRNAVEFVNNPKNLRIENDRLVASSIFKWYAGDFAAHGGAAAYLASLTDAQRNPAADTIDARLKSDFPARTDFRYDWTVNSVKNRPRPAEPIRRQP